MSSGLSTIPVAKRRQLAGTLGLFAVLFIAIGAVAATGADTALLKTFVVVALLAAVVMAMLAWGVALSVRLELEEQRVDSAVGDAIAAAVAGGSPAARALSCGCGHDHDPDELHVTDDPCAHDGAGVGCTHSCDTCVLARLRPAAASAAGAPASQQSRPSPATEQHRPRPRPSQSYPTSR